MKMASKNEVVRITFKELHEIVQNSPKGEQPEKSSDIQKKAQARRRPPIQLYQPGVSRLSKTKISKELANQERKNSVSDGENWDLDLEQQDTEESGRGSKESSVEPEVNGVTPGGHADAEASNQNGTEVGEGGSQKRTPKKSYKRMDNRRRGKRPDIQIYVPKGRLMEQDTRRGDGCNSPDSVSQPEYESESPYSTLGRSSERGYQSHRRGSDVTSPTSPLPPSPRSPSQRKVDLRFGLRNMQVTVVNEPGEEDKPVEMSRESGKENVKESYKDNIARERAKERQELLSTLRAARANSETLDSPELSRRLNKPSRLSLSRQNSLADTQSENENYPDTNDSEMKENVYKSRTSRSRGGGKRGGKRHSFSAMRRQRTGSFSSDVSASSDVSLEEEFQQEPKPLDWVQEMEQELARQVQDEAQRLNDYLESCVAGYPGDMDQAAPPEPKPKYEKAHPEKASIAKDMIRSQEFRGRRKERRRRPSGTESRESSVHSNYQDEDPWAPRIRPARRHKKRHSSAGSRGKKDKMDNFSDVGTDGSRRRRHDSHGGSSKEGGRRDFYERRHNSHELDIGSKREGFRRGRHDSYGESPRDNVNIKVTLDRNQRQVKVSGEQTRSESDMSSSQHAHSGGLLHLPGHQAKQQEHYQEEQTDAGMMASHHMKNRDQTQDQSRKMLFDPRNPNKPIVITNSKIKGPDKREMASSPQESNRSTPPTTMPQQHPPPQPPQPHPQQYYQDYRQGFTYPEMPYPGPAYGGMPPHPAAMFGYPQFPFKECGLYTDDTYTRDPYYHGGYDPDQVIGGRSKSQCRAMSEQLLRDTQPLDNQLNNLLSRRISGDDGWRRITKLRDELRSRYEQVIFLDADVSNKHGVEQLLWKSVYYQVIEVFRRHLGEDEEGDFKDKLHTVLNEGTEFFQNLLQKLQSTYSFNIDVFLDVNNPPGDNISRSVKLALLSVQRTYIFLGDIARYREQANETTNYGRARNWYMKAQQIAPKNGRPYNQLAILAMYTRRKLDAVYYYMRSLAASNPFLTARESLMSVFEDVRKKAEATEQKRLADKEKLKKLKQRRQQDGPRVEIWVSHDGKSVEDKVDETHEEDLTNLSAIELNKRFVLNFLNVHGKLFTKIGMETFPEGSCLMLREFEALLQNSPVVISSNRLIQLMAINMFAVENTALKDESLGETCRSLLQEHAVQLGLDMFGLLIKNCSDLLTSHLRSTDYPAQLLNEDLHQLVPGVKSWSDWMMCHPALWNPPPSLRPPDLGLDIDVWKGMSDLCNVLTGLDTSHVKIYRDRRESCEPIVLSEDAMMAGFIPMLSSLVESCYIHATTDKEVAKDCLRLEKLRLFGEYLCGIEPPMLSYNVETKLYFSVALATSISEEKDRKRGTNSSDSDDVIIESEDEADVESGEEDHVRHLKARRQELQKKKDEQTRHQENVQAILDENRHRRIELEIHPIFLIPDTNCFIDHLPGLKRILNSHKYTLVVPLVVINELDGLAKGSREGQYETAEHAGIVKSRSQQAIIFLEEEFERKNSHIRAQTSKGSILETISFRSEETDATGNNDDLILSCCLHYCKDKARDFMPKSRDASVRLYRDVVLLTDDRNLCLKAHTSNVPVKDVTSFKRWSNIT
ncbi:telomerase-binding protein EST1A-like [Haliotis cracherodii]|uniref:telomerase-binding protein EST1A-like n=1 Tax=Haliotis cracherodii TaxID=6455 RepID=UPI0039E9F6E6